MSLLDNEAITINRRSGDIFIKGKLSKGVASIFPRRASVQHVNPDKLMQLPELHRDKEVLSFLSRFSFELADIIIRNDNSKRYKVIGIENYNTFKRIKYVNAIAVSLDK